MTLHVGSTQTIQASILVPNMGPTWGQSWGRGTSPGFIGCFKAFSTPAYFERVEGWRIPLEARSPGTLAWKGQAPVIPRLPSRQLELQGRSRQQERDCPGSCRGPLCLEDILLFLLPGPPWTSHSEELFWASRKDSI